MQVSTKPDARLLDPGKFQDPEVTADGRPRATVELTRLETLWFNTGTLCNLTCDHCYIESSPRNDRLVYLSAAEVAGYLDELVELDEPERRGAAAGPGPREIGFTGGEPFMNPEFPAMVEDALSRGHRVLVLTNAMRPMMKRAGELLTLLARHGGRLTVRVSLDHYSQALHELERGPNTWGPALEGLKWLCGQGFHVAVAGRTLWGEPEDILRAGYARLFARHGIRVDAADPAAEALDVPEIAEACWDKLGVDPGDMMCASSRMVVKRKGAARPSVAACTLLPYEADFDLGQSLSEAARAVALNHPHCAKFCVLGGGSCSA
jgi:uncharacterized Fe-S cluster-containing radical SAM superfamily protein